jgi:DNA-binding protein HU-beta
MKKKAKTKVDFAETIGGRLNVEKQFVDLVLDYFIYEMKKSMKQGESVYIHELGTFSMYHKKATQKHNINTGETIPVPAKNIIKFSMSKKIIEQLNTEPKK